MKYGNLKCEFDARYSSGLINISPELYRFMSQTFGEMDPDEDVNEAFLFIKALQNGFDENEYAMVQGFIEYLPENLTMDSAFENAKVLKAYTAMGEDFVSLSLKNEKGETAGELLLEIYYPEYGSKSDYDDYIRKSYDEFISRYRSKIDMMSLRKAKEELDNMLKGDGEWIRVSFE